MKTELKFSFGDDEENRYTIITKAENYHNALKDISGWLNKMIHEGEIYVLDIDTVKSIDSKVQEIMLNWNVEI